jgi:hypothetical protein
MKGSMREGGREGGREREYDGGVSFFLLHAVIALPQDITTARCSRFKKAEKRTQRKKTIRKKRRR